MALAVHWSGNIAVSFHFKAGFLGAFLKCLNKAFRSPSTKVIAKGTKKEWSG